MEWVRPLYLGPIPYLYLLGGYMGFDYQFIKLLRGGDIVAAKNLLIRKYPHLRKDSDRIELYISLYQDHNGLSQLPPDKSKAKSRQTTLKFL